MTSDWNNFIRRLSDEALLKEAASLDATLDIAVQLDRIGNQLEHIARTLDTLAGVDRG